MKVGPSLLTPFIRSDAVGAILAETLGRPDVELSISEVARRAGVLPAVAHREVQRLIEAEVLLDRRDGNNRLVRANRQHPLYAPMAEIVAATYGPVPVLRELLATVADVQEAFVYGSWAARRTGEPGGFPGDLDVMVVGGPSRSSLADVAARARERLGIVVNIHRATPDAWAHPQGNPFLTTVAGRPTVPLIDNRGTHG